MTGLAAQIQLDESDFAFNSSGSIEVSGMLVSSRMTIDFLASKESPSEHIGFTMHPSLQEFYDFDAMGRSSESANIGYLRAVSKNIEIATKEEEKKQDNIQNLAEEVIRDRHEERMQDMRKWGDLQYTDEDLETALSNILKDREGVQARNGLTDEETDNVMDHVAYLLALSPEERAKQIEEINDPDTATIIKQELEQVVGERKSEVDLTVTSNERNELDDFFDMPEDDSLFSSAPPISDNFANEVAGIGPNAQSFAPKDSPDIGIQENGPSPLQLTA